MTRIDLDKLCDFHASRAMYQMAPMAANWHPDPFICWVADLGRREGEWMRKPPK